MLRLRNFFCVCLAYWVATDHAGAQEALLRIGQPAVEATLVRSQQEGLLQFLVGERTQRTDLNQLVRWSNPTTAKTSSEMLLSDGSRLVLAEAWTGQLSWELDEEQIVATTRLFGKLQLPIDKVQAIWLRPSSEFSNCRLFIDRQPQVVGKEQQDAVDLLFLVNGDRLEGSVAGISQDDRGQRVVSMTPSTGGASISLPEKQIAALLLGHSRSNPITRQNEKLIVGFRDGSLLQAESLITDDGSLQAKLSDGLEIIGTDINTVSYLRSLKSKCVYLSDCKPAGYRHLPYLEIDWPYRRDRNVLGTQLRSEGRIYPKGVGMPTAARLSYRLDSPEPTARFDKFVAEVALDDAAGRQGSVIFRVYLEQAGDWELAFESPIVHGGDAPLPLEVELGEATQLALVTDFADRGDELDYANWLDARLE